jgi:AhpD family alkylhydroperoxidase
MPLLPMLTREQVDPEVRPLWDECERTYPAFRHLWGTQAHSPIVFRHLWGQLLELKRRSPVEARHFEIGVVVASALNRCRYCVSHHAPLAEAAGLTPDQVEALSRLALEPLGEDHEFPPRPGFAADDSLVIDLAYFLLWSGIYPHAADVHPRVVHRLRGRLMARLRVRFSERQIEELTWRIVQCVAFNWHNDFLELDVEPGVAPREVAAAAGRA